MNIPRDVPVRADEFNRQNPVAIFAGPLLTMYREISLREARILLQRAEDIIMLNVLPKEAFELEHIPGSINCPVDEIERMAPRLLKPDDLIIVYCGSPRCAASAVAADKLTTIGYGNVMRFTGGMAAWKASGLPIEGASFEPKDAA